MDRLSETEWLMMKKYGLAFGLAAFMAVWTTVKMRDADTLTTSIIPQDWCREGLLALPLKKDLLGNLQSSFGNPAVTQHHVSFYFQPRNFLPDFPDNVSAKVIFNCLAGRPSVTQPLAARLDATLSSYEIARRERIEQTTFDLEVSQTVHVSKISKLASINVLAIEGKPLILYEPKYPADSMKGLNGINQYEFAYPNIHVVIQLIGQHIEPDSHTPFLYLLSASFI